MVSVEEQLCWYALYVKSRHEKTVAVHLNGKGYESFLPTYIKHHSLSKHFEVPLFPNYVFCRFQLRTKLTVVKTPGVFSIVGNSNQPSPVPDSEIEGVKRMTEAGLGHQPWPYIAPGQSVRLKHGPLRGLDGVVLDNSNEKWLVISIPLLQRSVAVKIDREELDYSRADILRNFPTTCIC